MKLYGKIKSERAIKGQGGNEFLEIEILNAKQDLIATIKAVPTDNDITQISIINNEKFSDVIVEKQSRKCECLDPFCAKCLLINCQDDNCKVHPLNKKKEFREMYKNRK